MKTWTGTWWHFCNLSPVWSCKSAETLSRRRLSLPVSAIVIGLLTISIITMNIMNNKNNKVTLVSSTSSWTVITSSRQPAGNVCRQKNAQLKNFSMEITFHTFPSSCESMRDIVMCYIHTWGARKSTGAEEESGAAKRNPRSVTNIFLLSLLSHSYCSIFLNSQLVSVPDWSWLTGCLGLNGCLVGCPSSKVMEPSRRDFPASSSACNAVPCRACNAVCCAFHCRALGVGRLGDPALPAETQCLGILNPCIGTSPTFFPVYHPYMRSETILNQANLPLIRLKGGLIIRFG